MTALALLTLHYYLSAAATVVVLSAVALFAFASWTHRR